MKQTDVEELQRFSKFIWDSEIWRVNVNIQHRFEKGYSPSDLDSLQLDLRQLLPVPGKILKHRQVGSVWIDATRCELRIDQKDEILVSSMDSREKVLAQYSQLVGKTLVHVEIAPPAGDTSFILGNGMSLRCFPVSCRNGDIWCMTSADYDELRLGPGSRWSYRSSFR